MIPKIFHQSSRYFTWEERQLSRRAQLLMPEWQYHAWTDEHNLALVGKICPHNVEYYLQLPNGGSRTDIARYLYMFEYGGIYFDTDFRFYQRIPENLLSYVCILGTEDDDPPEGGGPRLGNAFIGSEPGLPLWTEFVDSIFWRFRSGETYADACWLSGPHALTAFLRKHDRYREVVAQLPRNLVYPKLIRYNLMGAHDPKTIGVHLCWSSWREMSSFHKIKNRIRRILSALV